MTDKIKKIIVGALAVIIFGLVIFASRNTSWFLAGAGDRNSYDDSIDHLSFKYPADLVLSKSQIVSTGQTYLDLTPKQNATIDDSGVVEVIIEKDDNPSVSITDKILSTFPDKRKSDLTKLSKPGAEGVQLVQRGSGGELYIYDFFRQNGNIYLISFREKYYRASNSAELINNFQYYNQYLLLLNSITF